VCPSGGAWAGRRPAASLPRAHAHAHGPLTVHTPRRAPFASLPPSLRPRSVRKLVDKYARFIHLDAAHTALLSASIGTFAGGKGK
jgi:hypothetical protein